MDKITSDVRHKQWLDIIHACNASGLTRKARCEQNGRINHRVCGQIIWRNRSGVGFCQTHIPIPYYALRRFAFLHF